MAAAASFAAFCMAPTCWLMSSVALPVWLTRLSTSLATTAKPLPSSPARAAPMVALSASRLVRLAAMSLISFTTSPMRSAALSKPVTMSLVRGGARGLIDGIHGNACCLSNLTGRDLGNRGTVPQRQPRRSCTLVVACSACRRPTRRAFSLKTSTALAIWPISSRLPRLEMATVLSSAASRSTASVTDRIIRSPEIFRKPYKHELLRFGAPGERGPLRPFL